MRTAATKGGTKSNSTSNAHSKNARKSHEPVQPCWYKRTKRSEVLDNLSLSGSSGDAFHTPCARKKGASKKKTWKRLKVLQDN